MIEVLPYKLQKTKFWMKSHTTLMKKIFFFQHLNCYLFLPQFQFLFLQ